ncbi:MAG: glutathione S-transferase family protein [Burkholderiales bacterium]|nr:glutathione S-transferase family protein [Burkholderiales bacterium]
MSDLILHHYPTSPFSEKVRLILGYKKLAWKSVVVPPIMPKPDVVALTGGYRKTPFLQIGADIYCDTALICDILEHRQPTPTLYPAHNKGLARVLAQWADSTLFWTAMAYNFSPAGAAQVFPGATPESMKAFAEDRAKMRVAVPRMPPPDAAAACKSYLRRLANMLEEQPFLLGAAPCIADFAAYHPLWFTRHRTPAMAGILSATPGVLAWMDRMAALGHHDEQAFSAVDAIALAAASTPAPLKEEPFQDEHGMALGSQVTVFSDSFGPEPTQGELIAATRMHYTLRRSDERAGTVHVHFPRIGYILKKAATA